MNRAEKPRPTTAQRWEERMIADYYDYRWRDVIEPLCERLQRWKDGDLSHAEMEEVLEEVHRRVCEVRSLFGQRQDRLVMLIQWLDREWFQSWVTAHAPPEGVRLAPPLE